jgi:membrane-associated protease RseP (regulator of RpoE activity)
MRLIAAILCLVVSGCAPNLYQQWDTIFETWASSDMERGVWRTQSDVSWILGGPPSDCEPLTADPPKMGVWWHPTEAGTLLLVLPGGPAEEAGLRAGDRVVRLGDRLISTPSDAKSAGADLEPGVQTTVEFLRAVTTEPVKPVKVVLTPRVLGVEQCDWHVGGAISLSTTDPDADGGGDDGDSGSRSHQRSFRGTFRFTDGWLVRYQGQYLW